MIKRRIQKLISIFLAILLSGVLTAGVALADSLKGDADMLKAGDQSAVDLGPYSPGEPFTIDVLIYSNGSGDYGAPGAEVSLSSSTGGLSATSVTLKGSGSGNGKKSTVSGVAPSSVGVHPHTVTWSTSHSKFGGTGNGSVTLTFNIKVEAKQDTTPPVLTVPADITVEAAGTLTHVDIGTATATDDSNFSIDSNAPKDRMFPLGTTTVTWTARDIHGNQSTADQKITVKDTIKPVFTFVPANITKEATAKNTPVTIGEAIATDIFPVTVTSNAPEAFLVGETTVIWTATDANGNKETAKQLVTIVDTIKPVLIIPEDKTVEAEAEFTKVDIGTATATDIFKVTIGNDAPKGHKFPIGTTAVTWTATDENGNQSEDIQRITVQDTQAPVLTIPKDVITEATGILTTVSIGEATAIDASEVTITNDAPADGFEYGITQVTWTATDSYGHISTGIQLITITDTTKPVFTFVPEEITKEATAVKTDVEIGLAEAYDIFGATVTNNAPGEGFGYGTTEVVWTATDPHGNVTTATQKIIITDTTKPIFTFVPEEITKEATAVKTDVEIGLAEAYDIFGATVTNNAPGEGFDYGTTEVVWTATDPHGNVTTATQKIIIIDTTKPVFTFVPEDIVVVTTGTTARVNLVKPIATDIFDVTIDDDAPEEFPLGTTTVTWTATDANGNSVTAQQKVTVYGFSGVLSPVNAITTDQDPGKAKISQYKLGSTIPVKFYITDKNGKRVEFLKATLSIKKSSSALPANAELETATSTSAATTGNDFRYDSKEGQYIFNLDSKAIQSQGLGTYIIRIQLSNGQYFDYYIAFNK